MTEIFFEERPDRATAMERKFVEIVESRIKARGWKRVDFACKVWPGLSRKAASAKWADMVNVSAKTGRPQSVSLSDAQRIADALGEELIFLLVNATQQSRP